MEKEQCPYLTIKEFSRRYPGWTEGSIRYMIQINKKGFKKKVVRNLQGKILLCVSDFWKWIDEVNNESNIK